MKAQRGDVLGGRYELRFPIAVGGMGEVWNAQDNRLHREVAVKVLKPEYAGQAGFLQRFRVEARNAGVLTHPNVCQVFDYGETQHLSGEEAGAPTAYLVMELVPGEPLSSKISRDAPLPEGQVLDLMRQAAQGLGAAHAAGVVHRDVKPGNLLVTPDGTVKITDFGIARATGQDSMTATGQVMGTAQYLAPEQALGEESSPASDVYSLGVVGYQMLTGAVPFVRENQVATALAQVYDQVPPLPDSVSPGVNTLIMAMLRKDPTTRPANGRDAAAAITAVENGFAPDVPANPTTGATSVIGAARRPGPATESTTALNRPQQPPLAAPRPAPPKRGPGLPLIALLVLLAALLAGAAWQAFRPKDTTPTPGVTIKTTVTSTVTNTVTSTQTEAPSSSAPTSSSPSSTSVPPTTSAPTSTSAPPTSAPAPSSSSTAVGTPSVSATQPAANGTAGGDPTASSAPVVQPSDGATTSSSLVIAPGQSNSSVRPVVQVGSRG